MLSALVAAGSPALETVAVDPGCDYMLLGDVGRRLDTTLAVGMSVSLQESSSGMAWEGSFLIVVSVRSPVVEEMHRREMKNDGMSNA